MCQHCVFKGKKANHFLGCISKDIFSRLNKMIFPSVQYLQATLGMLGPVLGHVKIVVDKLERVQSRAARTLRRLENVTYKESLSLCVCVSN